MLASFMSGMAGNITAFNTVWTYDIYQSYLVCGRPDSHYLKVGRVATVAATVLSVGTAFIVLGFNSLMDYVQLLFSFFNAPLFATFLLGMFTTWATPRGGLVGLAAGTFAAMGHYLAYRFGWLHYGSEMTVNFYGAICAWTTCFLVTVLVSLFTRRKATTELTGLVYEAHLPSRGWGSNGIKQAWILAGLILLAGIILNWFFY